MKSQTHRERRLNPRITADVTCWLERESITLLGNVVNMSFGGLFLRTPVTLPEGHFVNLKLNIGPGIVEAQGYVVWNVSSPQNRGYTGLGIRIDRIVSGRKLFERFVEQNPIGENDDDLEPN